jgi:hypothetical protein
MKLISTIFLFFLTLQLQAQLISGKVIDSSSEKPLEYVSLGVIDAPISITTNERGEFSLDVKGQSSSAKVRISMIGYHPQTFSIEELTNKESIIKLVNNPVHLAEIAVRPVKGKLKKVGTTSYTWHGKFCGIGGLGGSQRSKGHEIGTIIELGSKPILLRSLHVCMRNQSFESSLFRLHIRNIVDNLPSEELLTENILIPITKRSGWVDIDLTKYNLVFHDDIALTIEWVDVIKTNKTKSIIVNGKKTYSILFNMKQKQGSMYYRWGSESKWSWENGSSPSFYLTVQE